MKHFFFLSTLLISWHVSAKVNVNFVPPTIEQGGTVELVFSSDTPFQHLPNLDLLQKDFVIGGQQKRQSAQWINGQGSTEYQLSYTLFPNKAGKITVQGLKIGTEQLPTLTLDVQSNAHYAQQGSLSLSVQCPDEPIYPSQRLICQVVLEDSLGLVDGALQAPQTTDGQWEEVQSLLPQNRQTDGHMRYQSLFAFTPKKSGRLDIAPFAFYGQTRLKTRDTARSRSIMDFMLLGFQSTATKPVSVQSAPLTLTVKEKPANYQGWWLPSTQVTLKEALDIPKSLHVGEPISRTLVLTAQGVSADAMPVPSAPQSSGLKVYANPEQRQDLPTGGEVSVTLTFVPMQAGTLTLPEISVVWFNTLTERIEKAVVPAHEIFVLADAAQIQPTNTPVVPVAAIKDDGNPVAAKSVMNEVSQAGLPWGILLFSVGFAFVLGVAVARLLFKRNQKKEDSNKKKRPLPDLYPF